MACLRTHWADVVALQGWEEAEEGRHPYLATSYCEVEHPQGNGNAMSLRTLNHSRQSTKAFSTHLQVESAGAQVCWAAVCLTLPLFEQARPRPTLRSGLAAAAAGSCGRGCHAAGY